MDVNPLKLTGPLTFKLRFNTTHAGTNLYWRIIVDDQEYLATSLQCDVPTYSESSFDNRAQTIKFHIAGQCTQLIIDEHGQAFLK